MTAVPAFASVRPAGGVPGCSVRRRGLSRLDFNTLLRQATSPQSFQDLRHSAVTLLLEHGVELVVLKELLVHARIGVTATVYAHVRLRLQRDTIDLLGRTLRNPGDSDEPPLCAAPVR